MLKYEMMGLVLTLLALLALPAFAVDSVPAPPTTAPPAFDPFGYREEQFSAWGLVDAAYPYEGRHGCYPMGNGVCFAHLGVSTDFNTLRGLVGPGYQTHNAAGQAEWWAAGQYSDIGIELRRGSGDVVKWTSQSIQVLRGTAIVRTKLSGPAGTLWGLSYASPDYPAIERHFVFTPADGVLDRSLRLYVNPADGGWDEHGGLSAPGGKRLSLWLYEPYQDDAGRTWSPGTCDPLHGSTAWSMALSFIHEGELPDLSFVGDPNRSRMLVKQHWDDWTANTKHFDTGNPKIDDLMLQVPVIIETQRDAQSGGVAPMVSYHGYWVRDSIGPELCYLENGRFDEVRRFLTYHRKACWQQGFCSMLVPLDVDVSKVEEPVGADLVSARPVGVGPVPTLPVRVGQSPRPRVRLRASVEVGADTAAPLQEIPRSKGDGQTTSALEERVGTSPTPTKNWDSVGVEAAEVPSLIVLEHYWYWKARRERGLPDDGFIAEAWPFLKRNLFGMEFDPTYGVKFHGDETYAHGALYSTFDNDTTADGAPPGSGKPLGYPNGYIPTDFFNRDNTLLHREAAKALAEMAGELGEAHDIDAAQKLMVELDAILARYQGPALSNVTHQQWNKPFANIDTGPSVLELMPQQTTVEYIDDMDSAHAYPFFHEIHGSSLDSQFATGHCAAGWLAMSLEHPGLSSPEVCLEELLDQAWPDAAWCEIYGYPEIDEVQQALMPPQPIRTELEKQFARLSTFADFSPTKYGPFSVDFARRMPVNIYGRINRIRPWESGVNYAVLARSLPALLERSRQVLPYLTPDDELAPFKDKKLGFPRSTQLLVLTRDNHYKDVIASDYRLASVPAADITPWDIGLPITVDDLRHALLWEQGDIDYVLPYLYLDRDVKLSDRRTFKTDAFWYGPEMTQLMADYKAAGGIVLEEADLRPSWELSVSFRPNPKGELGPAAPFYPGLNLRLEGPAGDYTCAVEIASDYNTAQTILAGHGVLPQPARLETSLQLKPGLDSFLPLGRDEWESLQYAPGSVTVSYTPARDSTAPAMQYRHVLSPTLSLASYLNGRDPGDAPEIPAARRMTPTLNGTLTPWDGRKPSEWPPYPSLGLLPADATIISGSFSPGGSDAGLSLSFAYDDLNLYIAGSAIDDQLIPGGLWSTERINFVFDARLDSTRQAYPEGSVDKDKWQADDYWIALAPFCTDPSECAGGISAASGSLPAALADAHPLVQRIGGSSAVQASLSWSESYKGFYGELPGAQCQVRLHEDGRGYDFELALPQSSLPFLDIRPHSYCGFGCFISDLDDNGPGQAPLAEAMWLTDWRAPGGGISWNFWDCGLLYFGW